MILLTGSTGFLGQNLLPHLKEKGYAVRCLIRQNSSTECLKNFCEDKVIGDILDESSLKYSMRGIDTVIHLAGIRMEIGNVNFESIFYLGTRHIVDVAKAAGVKRFIFLSTFGARPKAKSRFHHYKWLAEEYLKHSGLKYTVLRPTIIYGPHDHFVTKWMRKLKNLPIVPILGRGKNLIQPIGVEDVIQCILKSLTDPTKEGITYELAGPDRLSFREIVRQIGIFIGHKRKLFHWPLSLVKFFAHLSEFLLPHPPFTRDELWRWMEDRTSDHHKIEKEFQIKLTPFKEGLKQYFGPKL
ncbi:MAG: complex I NDUFA9 subunit family protein [Chlamydiae bacterium]|nr:complex I NDUFA9 subunit family protein [Chlamydiota bacterium]MBI3277987.1 complex I NDUFA9 subunit family protein [Chlamydiota bacterium]